MIRRPKRDFIAKGTKIKKRCCHCGRVLSLKQFNKCVTNKDGWHKQCKRCRHNKYLGTYESPSGRRARLKYVYGITEDEYNTLFDKQHGCCAICGVHQSQLTRRLHIDHDHQTGEIRGLLCMKCNRALGYFDDSIDHMTIAIQYLSRKGNSFE